MTVRARRHLFRAIRIAICVFALWFVARGVTWNDQVALRTGEIVTGTVAGEATEPRSHEATKGNVETPKRQNVESPRSDTSPNPSSFLILDSRYADGDLARDHDCIEILLSNGSTRTIFLDEVAVDEGGALKITYGLRTSWRSGRKDLLLLALCIQMPVALLLALRLKWMLAAQDIPLGYWECVKLSFAGNFLNFATPLGSNAGDVFKAYFLSLHTDRKTEAVTTIALDRALGLGTLVLVVAAIASFSPHDSRLAPFRTYTLTLLGIGVVGWAVYFSPWFHRWFVTRDWASRSPMLSHLQRIDAAARALTRRKGIVVFCVFVTAALQATAIGSYFVVAIAFGLDAGTGNALEYYAYFATGAVVQALPGPPQGLGTVELTYRYFFAPFGSVSQILCMAFFVRLVVLICALPGALVALTGAYRPRSLSEKPETLHATTGIIGRFPPH